MFIHTSLVLEPPASWQAEQEPATPVCTIAAVGTGVPKALVAALLLATAGSSVEGVLPRWQISHWVEVGRCDVETAGLVTGITTMDAVPWNGPAPLTWQAAQPDVTPLWLYLEPAKVGVSSVVRLVRLSTWQLSQPAAPMGRWLLAGALRAGVIGYSAALVVLWHCTQLVVVD